MIPIKILQIRKLLKELQKYSKMKKKQPSRKEFAVYIGQINLTKYLWTRRKCFRKPNPNIHLNEDILEECIERNYIKEDHGKLKITPTGQDLIRGTYILKTLGDVWIVREILKAIIWSIIGFGISYWLFHQ